MKKKFSADGVTRLLFPLFLAAVFAGLTPARADADYGTTVQPSLSSNRFLLVFDTSYAMRNRVDATVTNLEKLLKSEAGGQLREGDTIGIWTFNEKPASGLPLMEWMPEEGGRISKTIGIFLHKQHYAGKSDVGCVTPNLEKIVKASGALTTVIFCQGSGKLAGTPFDEPVNEFLATHGKKDRDELPLIIVLQSLHGTFTHYSLSANPWPIEIPALPPPAPAPKPAPAVVTEVAKPARPRAMAPPLILIGSQSAAKKTELSPAATASSETPVHLAAQPNTVAATAVTPVAAVPVPQPAAQAMPAPVATTTQAAAAQPTPASAVQGEMEKPVVQAKAATAEVAEPMSKIAASTATNAASIPSPVVAESSAGSSYALIGAIALAVLAVILAVLARMKAKAKTADSYITRSMRFGK